MVKLKGPGLATSASGQLAGELIFSNWKGKPYLKKHQSPKQPRTNPQIAMRVMMTWLSTSWAPMAGWAKRTWDGLAEAAQISPFNAYQRENLARCRSGKSPTCFYPATENHTEAQWQDHDYVCLGNHARLRVQIAAPEYGWGIAFFRTKDGAYPTTWPDLVHIMTLTGFTWHEWDFYPKTAGVYRFGWHHFTDDGYFSPDPPRINGICTLTP